MNECSDLSHSVCIAGLHGHKVGGKNLGNDLKANQTKVKQAWTWSFMLKRKKKKRMKEKKKKVKREKRKK